MEEVKYCIEEMSLDELKEHYAEMEIDNQRCSSLACSKCKSSKLSHTGVICGYELNCDSLRASVRALICVLEKKEQKTSTTARPAGRCEYCLKLDTGLYERTGYCFCLHWHNFTTLDGFCHGFSCKIDPQDVI